MKTIGFVVSESNLDKYTNIKVRFNMPTDAHVFERISNKLNPNNLSLAEKKKLILHFATTDSTIKFEGIGESSIKGLCLCRNNNGEYVKLGNMLSRSYVVPSWLSAFQICTEDYFSELDTYLIQEKIFIMMLFLKNGMRLNQLKVWICSIKRLNLCMT